MDEQMNIQEIENGPEMSESIDKLAAALAKAQGIIANAKKSEDNPFFKSKYADLAAIWDAVRAPLSDNEIAVIQGTFRTEFGKVGISSMLAHSSGQWIRHSLVLSPKDTSPQAVGSCLTYGKRYLLMGQVGVAAEGEDDDGNAASGNINYAENWEKRVKDDPKNAPAFPQKQEVLGGGQMTKAQADSLRKAASSKLFDDATNLALIKIADNQNLSNQKAAELLVELRQKKIPVWLKIERAESPAKVKLRQMVTRLGEGYGIIETEFASLDDVTAEEWVENFDPIGCPFISVKGK